MADFFLETFVLCIAAHAEQLQNVFHGLFLTALRRLVFFFT